MYNKFSMPVLLFCIHFETQYIAVQVTENGLHIQELVVGL
jgi:hypothetical protein